MANEAPLEELARLRLLLRSRERAGGYEASCKMICERIAELETVSAR